MMDTGVAIVVLALVSSSTAVALNIGDNVTITCPRLRRVNSPAAREFTYFPALKRERTDDVSDFVWISQPNGYVDDGTAVYCGDPRTKDECKSLRTRITAGNATTIDEKSAVQFTYSVVLADDGFTLRCTDYSEPPLFRLFEAPVGSLERVSLSVVDPDKARISGIDVIIDGEVQSDAKVDIGGDRRGNITFRCKATPSHGVITWELKHSGRLAWLMFNEVQRKDTIPTNFEPGPHTTGGADLIFHVTDLNNGDIVMCVIKTPSHQASRWMALNLAYPVAVDIRQSNGDGRYRGQKNFTVTASGSPTYEGIEYTRLDVVYGNRNRSLEQYEISSRIEDYSRFPDFKVKVKAFTFGIAQRYGNKSITLKLVETKREEVLWSKQVRVAEYVNPTEPPTWGRGDELGRGDENDDDGDSRILYVVLAIVGSIVMIVVCAGGGHYCRQQHNKNLQREREREIEMRYQPSPNHRTPNYHGTINIDIEVDRNGGDRNRYAPPPADVVAPPPFNSTGYVPGLGGGVVHLDVNDINGYGNGNNGFAPPPPDIAAPSS